MQHFNISFDVASIFVFLVVILIYRQQNLINNTGKKVFSLLITISLITPIADIISVISLDLNYPWLLYVSNTIYYLCLQFTAFLFFVYCCIPLARRDKISIS